MRVAQGKMGGPTSKGRTVARERNEIDTTSYSGRVAARIRKLVDDKGVPIKSITKAIQDAGHTASDRTVFAYLNNTRTIHPDLYPVFAKVLGMKLHDMLPAR